MIIFGKANIQHISIMNTRENALFLQGTVLIKNAEELMNFSKGEENLMELQIKAIADAGANVVVSGGKVADMALHYANKYNLMLIR